MNISINQETIFNNLIGHLKSEGLNFITKKFYDGIKNTPVAVNLSVAHLNTPSANNEFFEMLIDDLMGIVEDSLSTELVDSITHKLEQARMQLEFIELESMDIDPLELEQTEDLIFNNESNNDYWQAKHELWYNEY